MATPVTLHERLWTIGELAERARLTTSALRYYERRGLLEPTARISGQRRYAPSALHRLTAIIVCRNAGFSLDEIGVLLDAPPTRRHELGARKLADLEEQARRLETAQQLVRGVVECGCSPLDGCDVIKTVHPEDLA